MLYNQARTPYFTGAQHIKEVRNMKIKLKKRGNTYTFTVKNGGVTDFLFGFSDLSAFGNPTKKPEKIRGNFRKCNKILLNHDLDELSIALSTGDYFEIAPPVFSRGRTEKDIEEYCGMYEKGSVKPELPHLELQITVPPETVLKSIQSSPDIGHTSSTKLVLSTKQTTLPLSKKPPAHISSSKGLANSGGALYFF